MGPRSGWVGHQVRRVPGEGRAQKTGSSWGATPGWSWGRGAQGGQARKEGCWGRGSQGREERQGPGVPGVSARRALVPGGVVGRRPSRGPRPRRAPGEPRRLWDPGVRAGGAVPAETARPRSWTRQRRAAAAPVTAAAAAAAAVPRAAPPRDPRTRWRRGRCWTHPRRSDAQARPSARVQRLPWRPGKRWVANDAGSGGLVG